MRNALKEEDISLKLSSREIKKIASAIVVATNLIDNKNAEIDVLENYLIGLESRMEPIMAMII
jgi:hypothetical protein